MNILLVVLMIFAFLFIFGIGIFIGLVIAKIEILSAEKVSPTLVDAKPHSPKNKVFGVPSDNLKEPDYKPAKNPAATSVMKYHKPEFYRKQKEDKIVADEMARMEKRPREKGSFVI